MVEHLDRSAPILPGAFPRFPHSARHAPAPARLSYPAVLFSACQDHELSYDTEFAGRPNGAFTRTALDALAQGADTTPQAWFDRIRRQLPSDTYPQTPQLSGAAGALAGPLF